MPINHLVLFKFKATATADAVSTAYSNMLSLKDNCVRPGTGKPYIVSLTGGTSVSIEGMEDGMQYAFVVVFEDDQDRDYYVKQDPAHQKFVASLKDIMEKAIVFDYNC